MDSSTIKSRITLTIQAIEKDPQLTIRKASRIYNIPRSTLRHRLARTTPQREFTPKTIKLTELEEDIILQRILDLDSRGFQPRLTNIQEIADRLRTDRNATRVGTRWAQRFVKRHPELQTRFRRRIDYQRAQYKDPDVIHA